MVLFSILGSNRQDPVPVILDTYSCVVLFMPTDLVEQKLPVISVSVWWRLPGDQVVRELLHILRR
jgi:hypothetical protein